MPVSVVANFAHGLSLLRHLPSPFIAQRKYGEEKYFIGAGKMNVVSHHQLLFGFVSVLHYELLMLLNFGLNCIVKDA